MSTTYITTQGTPTGTILKNSGILRYRFGTGISGGSANTTSQNNALGSGDAYVCYCLGAYSVMTPDADGQLFGMSPGYDAITAYSASIFHDLASSGAVGAANAIDAGHEAGIRFPPSYPNTDGATGQARTSASGRIPAGTKVSAWFQMFDFATGSSTVVGEQPLPIVQTEVKENRLRTSGTISSAGPTYLSSIRVAVKNAGGTGSSMSGVLYVRLEHSFEDLPGLATQDAQTILGGS